MRGRANGVDQLFKSSVNSHIDHIVKRAEVMACKIERESVSCFFFHYFDSSLTLFSQSRKATTEWAPQPQLFKLSQVWSQAQRTPFSSLKWVNSTNLGSDCLPVTYICLTYHSLYCYRVGIARCCALVVHGLVILTQESVRLFSWSLCNWSIGVFFGYISMEMKNARMPLQQNFKYVGCFDFRLASRLLGQGW